MRSFWIFLRGKNDRREKVKLSFGGNRKSIALSVLEIFEFKLSENRHVCVCGVCVGRIFQHTGHMILF